MNEAFARAFNSRDLANLLALYEEDAALRVDDTGATHRGKEAIARELARLLTLPGTMVSLNRFCIQQGDLALLRADHAIRGADGAILVAGSSAEIVRRQADGSWLYVVDHAVGASLPRLE
jgi:ketosteroid isomerase-like protein